MFYSHKDYTNTIIAASVKTEEALRLLSYTSDYMLVKHQKYGAQISGD